MLERKAIFQLKALHYWTVLVDHAMSSEHLINKLSKEDNSQRKSQIFGLFNSTSNSDKHLTFILRNGKLHVVHVCSHTDFPICWKGSSAMCTTLKTVSGQFLNCVQKPALC